MGRKRSVRVELAHYRLQCRDCGTEYEDTKLQINDHNKMCFPFSKVRHNSWISLVWDVPVCPKCFKGYYYNCPGELRVLSWELVTGVVDGRPMDRHPELIREVIRIMPEKLGIK